MTFPGVYRHALGVVLSRLGGWTHVHVERLAFARLGLQRNKHEDESCEGK
ncbi:MAG: hypothetical protein R6X03_08775 [Methyloceanibacter sp.]